MIEASPILTPGIFAPAPMRTRAPRRIQQGWLPRQMTKITDNALMVDDRPMIDDAPSQTRPPEQRSTCATNVPSAIRAPGATLQGGSPLGQAAAAFECVKRRCRVSLSPIHTLSVHLPSSYLAETLNSWVHNLLAVRSMDSSKIEIPLELFPASTSASSTTIPCPPAPIRKMRSIDIGFCNRRIREIDRGQQFGNALSRPAVAIDIMTIKPR